MSNSFFVTDPSSQNTIIERLAELGHVDDYEIVWNADEQAYDFVFDDSVNIEEVMAQL